MWWVRVAVINPNIEIIKILSKISKLLINKYSKYGESALYIACKKDFNEIVEILCNNNNIDVNIQSLKHKRTPLHYAVIKGHLKCVKSLLNNNNIKINKKDIYGKTPIFYACNNGNSEILELLLNPPNKNVIPGNPNIKNNNNKPALFLQIMKQRKF